MDCSDDIALRELLRCVRELSASLQQRRGAFPSLPPFKTPRVSPYAAGVALKQQGGFRDVLQRAVVCADNLRDAMLVIDVNAGRELAMLCSMLRLACDDAKQIGVGRESVSSGCLTLFGNCSFASGVGKRVASNSGLKKFFGVFALRIVDNLSNLEYGEEIDSIVCGMLAFLGRELEGENNGYPYGIGNPGAKSHLDNLIQVLIQPRKPFKNEFVADLDGGVYFGVGFDEDGYDDDFETYSQAPDDPGGHALPDNISVKGSRRHSITPRKHEYSSSEISYKNGVLKDRERLTGVEKSFKVALFDSDEWLLGCMDAYSGDARSFANRMTLDLFCNILLAFSSAAYAIKLDGSKSNAGFKDLLKKVRFAGRCAESMLRYPPFDGGDSSMGEIFGAVSKGVFGFSAGFKSLHRPSDLNKMMIDVLSKLGHELLRVNTTFANVFGAECAACLDSAADSYIRAAR